MVVIQVDLILAARNVKMGSYVNFTFDETFILGTATLSWRPIISQKWFLAVGTT